MAKSDFTKTMRNITIDKPAATNRNRIRDSFQVRVDLPIVDKNRLFNVMKSELAYYNSLNEALGSRARTNPASIINVNEKWAKLFSQFAYDGVDIRKIYNIRTGDTDIPASLESYTELLTGKDSSGHRLLTDSMAMILEAAGAGNSITNVHPEVRRNMASEMLKFYQDQAKIIAQALPASQRDQYSYKTSPTFLEAMDPLRKRHVQIPRKIIELNWDEKLEQSVMKLPYIQTSLVFENTDLTHGSWNILIIHQQPGSVPSQKTPWVVDFKKDWSSYLLKYIDQQSASKGSALADAKWSKYTG